jgi:hypothetical protein
VQQHVQPQEFADDSHRQLAQLYWDHQRDEGEPEFAEFLGVLTPDLKELAISVVEEIEAVPADARAQTLADVLRHFEQVRRRNEEAQTLAELRRTSDGSKARPGEEKQTKESTSEADEIALLKKLQEQARRPDLRRDAT